MPTSYSLLVDPDGKSGAMTSDDGMSQNAQRGSERSRLTIDTRMLGILI